MSPEQWRRFNADMARIKENNRLFDEGVLPPGSKWNGIPADPRQDGYHVLQIPSGVMQVWRWIADEQQWTHWRNDRHSVRQMVCAHQAEYVGQVASCEEMSDRLATLHLGIGRDGSIHSSLETHGNPWTDVYRAMHGIKAEVDRLIAERRECPFNPRNPQPPAFTEQAPP